MPSTSGRLHIELRTHPEPLPELPAAVEIAAYRIAREAIANTVRHADATECTTTLEAGAAELIVTVQDDGIGVGDARRAGVGMTSMRERTEELGGTLEIVSANGGGTLVRATIPLVGGSVGGRGRGPMCKRPTRILVVDDHRLFREGLIALLRGPATPKSSAMSRPAQRQSTRSSE